MFKRVSILSSVDGVSSHRMSDIDIYGIEVMAETNEESGDDDIYGMEEVRCDDDRND
jgi:hypothetical protein